LRCLPRYVVAGNKTAKLYAQLQIYAPQRQTTTNDNNVAATYNVDDYNADTDTDADDVSEHITFDESRVSGWYKSSITIGTEPKPIRKGAILHLM
jgi:hypothetical protein